MPLFKVFPAIRIPIIMFLLVSIILLCLLDLKYEQWIKNALVSIETLGNSEISLDQIIQKDGFLAITYASSINDKFCKTLYSSISNRVPLMVVGLGGSSDKLNKKLSAFGKISNQLLNKYPDITLLFLDGFDVLFQQGPREIMKKYKEINTPLVYSAEKNCWPGKNKTFCDLYPRNFKVQDIYNQTRSKDDSKVPVRFLNSGLLIGSVLESVDFFKDTIKYIENKVDDDQEIANLIFTSGKHNMTVDYYSSMFQSMWKSIRDIKVNYTNGLFQNIRTGTFPSLIHFNGDKSGLEITESRLWYNQEDYKGKYGNILTGFYRENGKFVSFQDECNCKYLYYPVCI